MRLTAPISLVAASLALAMAACGGGGGEAESTGAGDTAPAPRADVATRTLAEGPRGPLRAGEVVARSAAEWQAAWREHEGPGDPPATDGVDFTNSVVVGLFAGQRPTGGFRVVPATVNRGGSDLYAVGYEVVSPGKGCMVSQGLTSPFLVMSIPTAPEVTFSSNQRAQDCQ
ncbi:MAG: protease complex subunit PrcB family protein [Actinomycetota bacterium]|nr:protease complex subunit PrcB family protein [Actinomycetota bacterium]